MKKLKLFLAAALMLCSAGAWAQTDVTSTYLTNADFSQDEPLTSTYLYGYGKDGSPYGFQTVTGWTSVVTNGDNSTSGKPNSGMAGGIFSYGSSTQLKGNSKAAPATNPAGEATGNCFGFFGVWGCGGYYYQTVTLAAGKYTITVPMYNQSGTQANTTYTGFFPTSGTNRTVAVNPTVGQWVNQTVTFTLTAETAGQIRIGYQSTGSGSGANPMLFIDCVKIEYTAAVVKDVLETAIAAAQSVNSRINNTDLTTAITTAQAVYNDENATQDEVNAAAATLNTAVETAMASHITNGGDATLALADADLASLDGWTVASTSGFNDKGNGLIGTYNVRFSAATVDDTHLATEYCLGFEARWSGNYASYNQTTVALPAGVYTLTYDVENVNGSTSNLTYADYNFVEVGGTKNYSSTTEWMQAKSGWTTHTINVTLEEPAPLTISFGYGTGGNNPSADVTPALYVSHVKLAWASLLDGVKQLWEEAKAAAENAIDNTEYASVTGEERTALQTEIEKTEPTTAAGYEEATTALQEATATFTAAKDAYDGLANLWNAGVPELIYATTEKYTAIGDAYFGEGDVVDAADASARTAAMITAIRAYYESHAMAEKVEGAVDCADAIAGADPETNTGWSGGIGTDNRSWEQYTDASGNAGGRYYDGGWSTSAGVNITMSRSIEIPAGKYLLTVTARGSEALTSYTLSVGENAVDLPKNGSGVDQGVFGHGWDDVSLEFESDGHPVTLTIAATSTEYQQWISFNRFRLVRLELNNDVYASATEYAALNGAIEAAEAKTLGFENSQYAPYNNVAALEALAAAKAINQTAELTNLKTDVAAATEALNDATWTANDGDMDAIYNGDFAIANGTNPKGWTRSNNGWGQQITGLTAEANGVAEGTTTAWYYNNNGAWQYGNDGLYTMPLAANQTYVLSFKYSKHGGDWQNSMKASVTNSNNEGLKVVQFTAADDNTRFVEAKAYFTTGAAGNYILSIEQDGNAHLTDVSLVKAESATLALNEGATFEPINRTFYEAIALTRKVVDGFNTVCLPFDLTANQVAVVFGENAKVYTYSENSEDPDKATINFNTKDDNTIEANVPVLIGEATASTDAKTFGDVMFNSSEAVVTGTNFDFVGTYAPMTVAENDYFIGNGAIYKSKGTTSMKAFRAYIKDKTNGVGEVKLYIDGLETGIEAIDNGQMTMDNEVIYNIAGQRVNKAQKGIYIVNGKKVLVK